VVASDAISSFVVFNYADDGIGWIKVRISKLLANFQQHDKKPRHSMNNSQHNDAQYSVFNVDYVMCFLARKEASQYSFSKWLLK
jgi:hypothetical protein